MEIKLNQRVYELYTPLLIIFTLHLAPSGNSTPAANKNYLLPFVHLITHSGSQKVKAILSKDIKPSEGFW